MQKKKKIFYSFQEITTSDRKETKQLCPVLVKFLWKQFLPKLFKTKGDF